MLAKKSAIVFFGKLIMGGANAGLTVVLARILGVDAFGLIGALLSYKTIAYAFGEFGFSNANLKRLSEEDAPAGDCISTYSVVRAVTSVGILLVGGAWTAYRFHVGTPVNTVVVYGLFTTMAALENYTDVYISTFDAYQNVESTQILRVSSAVLGSAATIGFVLLSPTVTAAAFGYAVQFCLKFLIGKWMFRSYPSGGVRWSVFVQYRKFALPNAAASIAGFIYLHVDRLLLKWLASAEAVGYLYGAQKYIQLLLMVSAATLSLVMTESSELHSRGDYEALRDLARRSQKYLSLITAPMIAGTAVFAAPLVHLVLGADYTASVVLLQVLCLQAFGMTISRPLGMMIYGLDRPGLGSALTIFNLCFGVGLTFLLVPDQLGILPGAGLGAMGVAVSLATRGIVGWALLAIVLRRLAQIDVYIGPIFHISIAIGIAVVIRYFISNWGELLQLAVGGSTVVFVYVALLVIIGEVSEKEQRKMKNLIFDILHLK